MQRELIRHLETVWDTPDLGIWEGRGPPQHYTYSKVMAWVALDRAIKASEGYGLEGPVARWRGSGSTRWGSTGRSSRAGSSASTAR